MSVRFKWDPKKAKVNFSKHGVSLEEAMTVFSDSLARIFKDDLHSTDEQREIIIGHSSRQRLLLVSFTVRETAIRILSAREATTQNVRIMKKTQSSKKRKDSDDLRDEYRFDYRKSKPNRFAAAMSEGTVAVVLERDVAAVFKSSEAVNSFLRSAISAMPKTLRPKRVLTRR